MLNAHPLQTLAGKVMVISAAIASTALATPASLAETCPTAGDCVPDPVYDGASDSWTLRLCPTATFADLQNAIDHVMCLTTDNSWDGHMVTIEMPPTRFDFTTTLQIDFDLQNDTMSNPQPPPLTPATLRFTTYEKDGRTEFRHQIHGPLIEGRRMIVVENLSPGLYHNGVSIEFDGIDFIGNENFVPEEDFRLGDSGTECCPPADWETPSSPWRYRSGVESSSSVLLVLNDCHFDGFATLLHEGYEAPAHPHLLNGAAVNVTSHGQIIDCSFTNNYAGLTRTANCEECDEGSSCCGTIAHYGGAICYIGKPGSGSGDTDPPDFLISGCTFEGNLSRESGGAVHAEFSSSSSVRWHDSIFTGNLVHAYCTGTSCFNAQQGGGAIFSNGMSESLITACVFTANRVENGQQNCNGVSAVGGAVMLENHGKIVDSTFTDNLAEGGYGSALFTTRTDSQKSPGVAGSFINCSFTSSEYFTESNTRGSLIMVSGNGGGLDVDAEGCTMPETPDNTRFINCDFEILNNEYAFYARSDKAVVSQCTLLTNQTQSLVLIKAGAYQGFAGDPGGGEAGPALVESGFYSEASSFCNQSSNSNSPCLIELSFCGDIDIGEIESTYIDLARAYLDADSTVYGFTEVFCPLPVEETPPPACWSRARTECSGCQPCPGDFDCNGMVNGSDLSTVLAGWNTANGDLNGDGNTNGADLAIVLAYWGPCPDSP